MNLIEKIKPTGINTDIHPEAVESGNQGNRRVINPLVDAVNKHYYTSETNDGERSQNIKGNVLKSNSLPGGTNTTIGCGEDKLHNVLVFFNHNSNGTHGVYTYSPETDTISKIIENSLLNFSIDRRYMITGFGCVGDLYYWSDGLNAQRALNRLRDYSYASFDIKDITVIKRQPISQVIVGENGLAVSQSPILNRGFEGGGGTNFVTDKNFQFAYRFKFLDNEYSTLSPISVLSYADFDPDPFKQNSSSGYTFANRIRVRVALPTGPEIIIKSVDLLVRQNNGSDWSIFKTVNSADFIGGGIQISEYFTGAETLTKLDQPTSTKLFEAIPNSSKGLVTHRNRLFINSDSEGFDLNQTPQLTISELTAGNYSYIGIALGPSNPQVMDYGSQTYTLGFGVAFPIGSRIAVYLDALGSPYYSMGYVTASTPTSVTVNVDYTSVSPGTYVRNIEAIQLQLSISGLDITGKPVVNHFSDTFRTYWKTNSIHYFGLAVFDEEQRCMGIVSKTKYKASGPNPNPVSAFSPVVGTFVANTMDINLDVALSGTFVNAPKAKYYSLCVTDDQFYQTYQQMVVKVLFYRFENRTGYVLGPGEYLFDNKIFVTNPSSNAAFSKVYLMLPKQCSLSPDISFYVRPLMMFGANARIERVQGISNDCLIVDNFGMSDADVQSFGAFGNPNFTWGVIELFKPREVNTEIFYEISKRVAIDVNGTPTEAFTNVQGFNYRPKGMVVPIGLFNQDDRFNFNFRAVSNPGFNVGVSGSSADLINPEMPTPTVGINNSRANIDSQSTDGYSGIRIVSPDYTKIADNRGKVITEIIDKKAVPRPTVIRFSNKFVQDSNINGMSAFDFSDQYSLDYSRGAITKLVSLGTRIIAVHERASTVVYTEEKMIKNAQGGAELIAATEAIGYDQQLEGGYGSVHPESIASVDNMIFGFDIYKGVVWRYTQEGQFPISDYGMKNVFRDLARSILPIKSATKIIGGIDPYNKEYIITFRAEAINSAVTYAYNYIHNVWTTRYTFWPEMYGTIGNKFISFRAGELWVHNENPVCNNFYNFQNQSFLKFAINPYATKVKLAQGIQLAQEAISSNPDFKQVEITTDAGQYSYLKADEFEKLERVYYATILKDVNTPPATIPGLVALRQGDDMRAKMFYIQINDDSVAKNSLQMANMAYVISEYSE